MRIRLGVNLRLEHIREGMDVYLECDHDANPSAHAQSWLLSGRPVQPDRRKGVLTTHNSLVLQKVRRASAGKYECAVQNSLGQSLSAPLMLRIQCEPFLMYFYFN